jgi:D-sedoheptulose 7-phosphate isomerase
MESYYKNYLKAHDVALSSLEITDRGGAQLNQDAGFDQLCGISAQIRDAGRTKYLVGNGASAAFANHMALDWTKNGGVPSHSFANSALLTAVGNDLGYEEAFSAPLSWYAKSGDLLVTISSSGNSPNIVKTIEVARAKGMSVVTFSGLKPDNQSRQLGDINLYIPAKTYGIVECAHQVLLHVWLDKFMGISEWDRDGFQNMNKREFSL